MKSIGEVAREVHALAVSKGWWPNGTGATVGINEILAKLALVHSEVSEALEAARDPKTPVTVTWFEGRVTGAESAPPKPEGFAVELADVVIRVFDLAEALGLDIQKAIETKHAYNTSRSHRHGGKAA